METNKKPKTIKTRGIHCDSAIGFWLGTGENERQFTFQEGFNPCKDKDAIAYAVRTFGGGVTPGTKVIIGDTATFYADGESIPK